MAKLWKRPRAQHSGKKLLLMVNLGGKTLRFVTVVMLSDNTREAKIRYKYGLEKRPYARAFGHGRYRKKNVFIDHCKKRYSISPRKKSTAQKKCPSLGGDGKIHFWEGKWVQKLT